MKRQATDEVIDKRAAILDATEAIMIEHGYAGVSARKVASQAGLKSNLLHYYFASMDELFMAVFHRLEQSYDERFGRALASDRPLIDLWRLGLDSASTRLIFEFNALASHRPAIKTLIARSARRDRSMFVAALTPILERLDVDSAELPADILAVLMSAIARMLSAEQALGMSDSHAKALVFVERFLERLDDTAPRETAAQPAAEG